MSKEPNDLRNPDPRTFAKISDVEGHVSPLRALDSALQEILAPANEQRHEQISMDCKDQELMEV